MRSLVLSLLIALLLAAPGAATAQEEECVLCRTEGCAEKESLPWCPGRGQNVKKRPPQKPAREGKKNTKSPGESGPAGTSGAKEGAGPVGTPGAAGTSVSGESHGAAGTSTPAETPAKGTAGTTTPAETTVPAEASVIADPKILPSPPSPRRFGVATWATLGAGVALLGAGGALWGVGGIPSCDAPDPTHDCPQRYRTDIYGIPLAVGGGALIVTSAVLFVLDARRLPEKSARLSPRGIGKADRLAIGLVF